MSDGRRWSRRRRLPCLWRGCDMPVEVRALREAPPVQRRRRRRQRRSGRRERMNARSKRNCADERNGVRHPSEPSLPVSRDGGRYIRDRNNSRRKKVGKTHTRRSPMLQQVGGWQPPKTTATFVVPASSRCIISASLRSRRCATRTAAEDRTSGGCRWSSRSTPLTSPRHTCTQHEHDADRYRRAVHSHHGVGA